MLYLEDYLEMIEHLPQELRDRLTDMRELDLQVHNDLDSLEEQSKQFFTNAKKQKQEIRDSEFLKLKQDYYKTLEGSDEKINIATQVYELVERYLRRLDSELQKFKLELEADNPGITEILEKRSLELDMPSNTAHPNHGRRRSALNSVNNINNHRELALLNNYPSNHSLNYIRSDSINSAQNSHHNSSLNSSIHSGLSPFDTSLNINNQNMSNSNLSSLSCHNPTIVACASQAIAATHQTHLQGRRTASFKSTYEAINSAGLQNMGEFNMSYRDSSLTHSGSNLANQSAMLTNNQCSMPNAPGQLNNEDYYPRINKRSRTASHLNETDKGTSEFSYDPNEQRYCTCNEYSYGDMVACDNADCQYEWFHYGCVGITHPPRGRWFCASCTEQLKKKAHKKEKL